MGKVRGTRKCCNPFFDKKHPKYVIVFSVNDKLVEFAKDRKIKLKSNGNICHACRNKIYKYKVRECTDQSIDESISNQPSTSSGILEASSSLETNLTNMDYVDSLIGAESDDNAESDDSSSYAHDFSIELIDTEAVTKCTNELLNHLDLERIKAQRMRGKQYQIDLFYNLMVRLSKIVFPEVTAEFTNKIIEQLKEKFEETESRNVKIKILSILPREWSVETIQNIFESASYHIVYHSKKLVAKYGILCDTIKKTGTKIPENTLEKIKEFYRSDDISRACPGLRDYAKSYDENGQRIKMQRRLILLNLREAYEVFKTENPNDKIGFSKFCSVRPPECVLASATHGIHTTCVCVKHQNVKLIIQALQKIEIVDRAQTYRDLMQMLLCTETNDNCRLNKCDLCPGIGGNGQRSSLRSTLFVQFEEKLIEKISFKQWINAGS